MSASFDSAPKYSLRGRSTDSELLLSSWLGDVDVRRCDGRVVRGQVKLYKAVHKAVHEAVSAKGRYPDWS